MFRWTETSKGTYFAIPMHSRYLLMCFIAASLGGCIHVKMDPLQVHAVVDVNVRVEREVAGLLSDIYGNSATIKVPNSPAK